ncbi:rhomboid-like protein [Streptomyces sp. SCSIO 30461]|uniref:rhomboid-like protein n=1 Tax=Streptomyces sp. SCSIO 30461 TaxID=3118085 RepID=UPI0030D56738
MSSQSPSGPLSRLFRAARAYPRRAPLTFAYVCLLLSGHAWLGYGLSDERAVALLDFLSTNPDNLRDHPVAALLGSALFFDGTLTDVASPDFIGTLITLGLGVGGFLAWAECRWGTLRAAAAFLGGHIAATLLTAVVIIVALRQDWYPTAVRQASDYGVSYGAQTVLALGILAMPRRYGLPWAVFVLAWPIGGLEWMGPLPDFTTIGHIVAALIGFGIVIVSRLVRSRSQEAGPSSAPHSVVPDSDGPGSDRGPDLASPAAETDSPSPPAAPTVQQAGSPRHS